MTLKSEVTACLEYTQTLVDWLSALTERIQWPENMKVAHVDLGRVSIVINGFQADVTPEWSPADVQQMVDRLSALVDGQCLFRGRVTGTSYRGSDGWRHPYVVFMENLRVRPVEHPSDSMWVVLDVHEQRRLEAPNRELLPPLGEEVILQIRAVPLAPDGVGASVYTIERWELASTQKKGD